MHYTRATYPDTKIDQHPIASRFPHPPPDAAPSVLPGYDHYIDLMEPDKTLHSLDDFVYSDRSQLSLHSVTFRDATLVILKLPHSAVDVMGFYASLKNWSRVLAGRTDLVQPLADPDKDVVAKIAELDVTVTKHPHHGMTVAGQKQLTGLGLAIFILRFIFLLIFGGKQVPGTIFLPAKTIHILKTQARRDLEAEPSASATFTNSDKDDLFVSESDIIAAWTSRVTLSTESHSSTQDVAIMDMVDMRGRVPGVFGKQPSPDGHVWCKIWSYRLSPIYPSIPFSRNRRARSPSNSELLCANRPRPRRSLGTARISNRSWTMAGRCRCFSRGTASSLRCRAGTLLSCLRRLISVLPWWRITAANMPPVGFHGQKRPSQGNPCRLVPWDLVTTRN